MKLGVVIPNYNGARLLREFLPSVLASAERAGACAIVIVDDASSDASLQVIAGIAPDARVIERKVNGGFGEAVNEGARSMDVDLLCVCMTDMELQPDCLEKALPALSAPDVFAVGFHLKTSETTGNGGVTALAFSRGLFHAEFPGEEQPEAFTGPTDIAFAVGGAMIVRKSVFDALGGFDPVYAPYGWEDIDLCYRAWRSGWRSVNEPEARGWHRHPHTSVQSHAHEQKREIISLRNRMLFVRRNFTSPSILREHARWVRLMKLRALLRRSPVVSEADRQAARIMREARESARLIEPMRDEASLVRAIATPLPFARPAACADTAQMERTA